MTVSVQDYMSKLLDQSAFMVSIMAVVQETSQIFTATDECRLLKPNVIIEVRKAYNYSIFWNYFQFYHSCYSLDSQ